MYPNPVKGEYLFLDLKEEVDEVVLMDLQGKIIKTLPIEWSEEYRTKINVAQIANGTYILQIKTKNSNIVSHEIVISN